VPSTVPGVFADAPTALLSRFSRHPAVEQASVAHTRLDMVSMPAREWLAVLLPLVFGLILLGAGAAAAADADTWTIYVLAAIIGVAVPLGYTLHLVRERRLFLSSANAIARSRSRSTSLIAVGWLIGAAALIASGVLGRSARSGFYAALGGAAIGFWPGLLANFIRLWRERRTAAAAPEQENG